MPDPVQVRAMFGRIARRYDLLNRLLSAGIDRRWRARLLALAGEVRGRTVVDACCGTGDLALAFAARGARVVGVDFTPEMLQRAGGKLAGSRPAHLLVHGDALRLPLRAGVADVAGVAFGLRNLADLDTGLTELVRVVRPGGLVLVLEFAPPSQGVLGALYSRYLTLLLPRIGGLVSGDPEAYRYLCDSVLAWPSPEQLCGRLRSVGLEVCGFERLTGGIACLHWGRVPLEPRSQRP